MKAPETTTQYLPYDFTPAEKRDIAASLAQANQQYSTVEKQKKQVMADFTAQLAALDSVIEQKSRLYAAGKEYRDIDCTIHYHKPSQGLKTIVRNDTGEVVKDGIQMTPVEMQEELPFEPKPDPYLAAIEDDAPFNAEPEPDDAWQQDDATEEVRPEGK